MIEPIVSRESVRALAEAAAASGQKPHAANPYPPLTEAHALWELSYRLATGELEAVEV